MYTALAKFYDLFMSDVDTDKWTDYICAFLKERKRGVDAACGTGRFTLQLIKRGYDVFGLDLSAEMLNAAKQNALSSGIRAEFIQGDMRTFEYNKSYEFIIAMCDAVNYIAEPMPFFINSFNALERGGILIFDISSAYKLKNVLGSNTYSDSKGDITYIWNNSLTKNERAVDMDLTFFERRGALYEKSAEHQRQYVHESQTLISFLNESGFSDIKVYGGITKKNPSDIAERLHFIAHKK